MKNSVVLNVFGMIAILSSLGYGSGVRSQTEPVQEVLCEVDCHRSGLGVEKVQGYGSNISEAFVAAKQLCVEIGGTPLGACRPISTKP